MTTTSGGLVCWHEGLRYTAVPALFPRAGCLAEPQWQKDHGPLKPELSPDFPYASILPFEWAVQLPTAVLSAASPWSPQVYRR